MTINLICLSVLRIFKITIWIRIQRFQKSQSELRDFKNHNPDPTFIKKKTQSGCICGSKAPKKLQSTIRIRVRKTAVFSREIKNHNPDPRLKKNTIRMQMQIQGPQKITIHNPDPDPRDCCLLQRNQKSQSGSNI